MRWRSVSGYHLTSEAAWTGNHVDRQARDLMKAPQLPDGVPWAVVLLPLAVLMIILMIGLSPGNPFR